jgi:hypothetical protein
MTVNRDYTICCNNSLPIGNLNATDPFVGSLQDNVVKKLTHALLAGSPAINNGGPAFSPPPANDQRGPGYPRVMHERVAIGELEMILEIEVYLPVIRK